MSEVARVLKLGIEYIIEFLHTIPEFSLIITGLFSVPSGLAAAFKSNGKGEAGGTMVTVGVGYEARGRVFFFFFLVFLLDLACVACA